MQLTSNIPARPQECRALQAPQRYAQHRKTNRSGVEVRGYAGFGAMALLAVLAAPMALVAQTITVPTSTGTITATPNAATVPACQVLPSPTTSTAPASTPGPSGSLSSSVSSSGSAASTPPTQFPYVISEPPTSGSSSTTTVVMAPDASTAGDTYKAMAALRKSSLPVGGNLSSTASGGTTTITGVTSLGVCANPEGPIYSYAISGSGFGDSQSAYKLTIVTVAEVYACTLDNGLDGNNSPLIVPNTDGSSVTSDSQECPTGYNPNAEFYEAMPSPSPDIGTWSDNQITITSSQSLQPVSEAPGGDTTVLGDTEPLFVLTNLATGAATSYCWSVGNNCQTTSPFGTPAGTTSGTGTTSSN